MTRAFRRCRTRSTRADARGDRFARGGEGPLQPDRAGADAGGASRAAKATSAAAARCSSPPASTPAAAPRTSSSSASPRSRHIWWENNAPLAPEHFDRLHADMRAHIQGRRALRAGPLRRRRPRLPAERAGGHRARLARLFIRHLLRRPDAAELAGFAPEFTILNCPSFQADPARHGCRSETVIAISFEQRLVLIGGTAYAGENKKSVFTILNYLLPEQGVMPMHCSANHAPRRRRRRRGVLRPFGHGQDHAFGRPRRGC